MIKQVIKEPRKQRINVKATAGIYFRWGRKNCAKKWHHQSPGSYGFRVVRARVGGIIQKLGIVKETVSWERSPTQNRARGEIPDFSSAQQFSTNSSH